MKNSLRAVWQTAFTAGWTIRRLNGDREEAFDHVFGPANHGDLVLIIANRFYADTLGNVIAWAIYQPRTARGQPAPARTSNGCIGATIFARASMNTRTFAGRCARLG